MKRNLHGDRQLAIDLAAMLGCVLLVYGTWQIADYFGIITAGAILLAASIVAQVNTRRAR